MSTLELHHSRAEQDGERAEAYWVNVTPELASAWLDTGSPNRNLSPTRVAAMAADIAAGTWYPNGETIKFNKNGQMWDGQHRLSAIVRAGRPAMMLVVHDVDDTLCDNGGARTVGHALQIHCVAPDGPGVAAATSLIIRYENTKPGSRLSAPGPATRKTAVFDRASSDTRIAESVRMVGHGGWEHWMNRSIMSFVHYMGRRTSPVEADKFIEACRSGRDIHSTHPAMALRNTLMPRRVHDAKPTTDHKAAIAVKAWLVFEAGGDIKQLRYKSSEPFPRFRTNWPNPD